MSKSSTQFVPQTPGLLWTTNRSNVSMDCSMNDLLDIRFSKLKISDSSVTNLKERFKDNLSDLLDLLNCLETEATMLEGYNTISSNRLEQILIAIASYNCGLQQLIQLKNELYDDNIKLQFIEPIKAQNPDEYAFKSKDSLVEDNKIIYISVHPENSNPNPKGRMFYEYDHKKGSIKIRQLDEEKDFNQNLSLEGYKCGHEISHAIAFVRVYKSQYENVHEIRKDVSDKVHKYWEDEYTIWPFFSPPQTVNKSTMWDIFFKPEEYRNVVGLGINKSLTKEEKKNNIIGEFDYINEFMQEKDGKNHNKIYIRIYDDNCYREKSQNGKLEEMNQCAFEICKQKYIQLY